MPLSYGNANYYVLGDKTHPTWGATIPGTGGHEFFARTVAAEIRAVLTAARAGGSLRLIGKL